MRLLAAVVFVSVCAGVLIAQSLLDRVVSTFPADQTIQLQLPPTSFWFEHTLDLIASSTQVLMGVESVEQDSERPNPSDPLLILTGRPLGEAVHLLVNARPGYVWRADGDIVHVLRANGDDSILARRLENFTLENATPLEAARLLCETLQPAASRRGGYAYSGPPPSPIGERRFTVPTMTGSLLQALDAIAKQHGALIWHVTDRRPTMDAVTESFPIGIGFVMFDGWGIHNDRCIPRTH